MKKFRKGHWYKVTDELGNTFIGEFMGRQEGFACRVCDMGHRCYCFNIWHSNGEENDLDYETVAYGPVHMPTIIEDYGKSEIIVDGTR